MEPKPIQPTLGIFDGLKHISPGEALVNSGITISSKASMDVLALRWGDELGCVRVVLDKPVRANGDENSCNSLLL